MHQLKDTEVDVYVVGKPIVVLTNTKFNDLPTEIQNLLNEHDVIMVDNFPNVLPLVRSVNHHIDLILGTSLPNKYV